VVLMMRASGLLLAVVGFLGVAGSLDVNSVGRRPLELLPIFLLILAAAAVLFIRAQRQSRRDAQAAPDRKLPPPRG
jgi:hypothetical protein